MATDLLDNPTRVEEHGVSQEQQRIEAEPSQGNIKPLKIKDLPEKAQRIALDALAESQKDVDEIDTLIENGDKEKTAFALKKSDCDRAIDGTKTISPDAKVREDENLRAVQQELDVLKAVYAKLSKGMDAPELRSQFTQFFTEFQPENYFTQDEIATFLAPRDIAGRLRQAVARFSPGKKTVEAEFQRKMRKVLYDRGTGFLEKIKVDCVKRGEPVPQILKDLEGLPLILNGMEVDSLLDDFVTNTNKASGVIVSNNYYFGKLSECMAANEKDLEKVLIYAGQGEVEDFLITPLVSSAKTRIEGANTASVAALNRLQTFAEPYPAKLEEQEAQVISGEIKEKAKIIFGRMNPFGEAGNMHGLDGAGATQEFMDLYKLAKAKERAFSKSTGEQQKTPDAEDISSRGYFTKAVENLAYGENLLLHAAGYEDMKQILREGTLASRKTQVDLYGKSKFSSSGIEAVGKDYVRLIGGREMSKDEYEKQLQGRPGAKRLDQESHLISFSENYPYRESIYYHGFAFVFSKSKLFSKSQFTEADGWQLFDRDFDDSSPDSPGFSVDLTKEPMTFLVDEDKRQDFEEFVKSDLSRQPRWQNTIQDPDVWIGEHVVYKPKGMRTEDYRDNILPQLREKMFKKYPDPEEVGTVIPTGEFGETVGGPSALFSYKLAA
ncbi:MAG: hypothetical protein M1450_04585 [Patescibacteria group bacterium]|nr:hypothetical protein [Patescibacteria group bacterium]